MRDLERRMRKERNQEFWWRPTGRYIRNIAPLNRIKKRFEVGLRWQYIVPPLKECRSHWDEKIGEDGWEDY